MKRIIALFFGTILTCGVGPTHVSVAVGDAEVLTAGLRVRQHSGGDLVRQDMTPFPLGEWHNGDHLWWTGANPGDQLVVDIPIRQTGRQELLVVLTRAPDYGIVQFELDGQVISGQIDAYCQFVMPTVPISLGVHDLDTGNHQLSVRIVGANEKSTGQKYLFGLDRIILRPTKQPLPADKQSTAMLDELSRLECLPRLREGTQCEMFSSYDRTGGNNDGFGGTFSQLWIEDGNSVLAAMDGPGCIQRIWFTHSEHRSPGLLNLKKEHIKIYVDHQQEPVLDVPLEDLLDGKLARFPKPLVGEGQGGYYCYVPIPYRDGCKVVVEGTGVRFYQITYRRFANANALSSFQMDLSPEQQKSLDRAVRLWSNLGDVAALGLKNAATTTVELSLKRGQSETIDLPQGRRMVRAVLLDGEDGQSKDPTPARLTFHWDCATMASVDLPLDFFFCRAFDPPPFRSLLAGTDDDGSYNFMPMPYRRSATLTISGAFHGRLRVITVPLGQPIERLGYLHAAYHKALPVVPNRHHVFLRREGTGHYMGTYLVTEGQTDRRLPLWLEGDDRFTVDGKLVIHGTGSEDYFNCGWYAVEGRLNGPGGMPLHGFPVYRLVEPRNQAVAYRWHLTDPVAYQKSIIAEMEHGGDNRQEARYRSAAFFYEPAP